MLSDPEQADTDILGADAHNLTDLLVTQFLQPEKHDGAVEGLELGDTFVEHIHLACVLITVLEEVDVHGQRDSGLTPFLPVDADAGVKTHSVDPRLDVAAMLEALETTPQVDQCFLEEVVDFVGVLREHVTHGVNRASMLLDGLRKL